MELLEIKIETLKQQRNDLLEALVSIMDYAERDIGELHSLADDYESQRQADDATSAFADAVRVKARVAMWITEHEPKEISND